MVLKSACERQRFNFAYEALTPEGGLVDESDDPIRYFEVICRRRQREAGKISDGTKPTSFEGFDGGQRHWADVVDAPLQSKPPGRRPPGKSHPPDHRVEKDFR